MSFSGSVEAMSAFDTVPSMKETRTLVAPSTTWNAVRMEPFVLMITPAPSPESSPLEEGPVVSISTSDGRICW